MAEHLIAMIKEDDEQRFCNGCHLSMGVVDKKPEF